jgi:hypothetical protein
MSGSDHSRTPPFRDPMQHPGAALRHLERSPEVGADFCNGPRVVPIGVASTITWSTPRGAEHQRLGSGLVTEAAGFVGIGQTRVCSKTQT